jgi:hypothetical protein
MAADTHTCLHEEEIINQSRIIERMSAELSYKKERLDDLKEDNKRMETKIDDIKECMDKIVIKSQSDDNKLEKRLVAIETEQKVSKEATNKKLVVIGLILTVITIIVNIIMR